DHGVRITLEQPDLREYGVQRGQARSVAVVGRAAHAVVIRAVERARTRGARSRFVGQSDRRYVAFEVPDLGFGVVDDLALPWVGRVEMRALRREGGAAEKATLRNRQRCSARIHGERF